MSWLINQLGNIGAAIFKAVMAITGYFADKIVTFVLQTIVLPVLNNTIFKPFSITNQPHSVGGVLLGVWETLAVISAMVALTMLVFAVFSHMAGNIGGRKSWGEVAEGLMVWLIVLVGGWTFLNLLVQISNAGTQALKGSIDASAIALFSTHVNTATSAMSTTMVIWTDLMSPLVLLLMGALALWAAGVWLMRQIDLVLYGGLLPLTAALGINGNKTPFKWAWSEAMGAVFNQLAMAFILWVGFSFISPSGTGTAAAAAASGSASIDTQFVRILLAITTFTLAARAPQILANLTGHHNAGSGHLLAGMALGYMGAKGFGAAAKMSPAGQAVSMAVQGRQGTAAATAMGWSGRPSMGDRVKNSAVGQAVSQKMSQMGYAARNSKAGQAVSQAASDMAEAHPTLARAAKGAAGAAGSAARTVSKPLRTAASMAYQPMATLGNMAAGGAAASMATHGVGSSAPEHSRATMAQSQAATMSLAQDGVEATGRRLAGSDPAASLDDGIAQAANLTNSSISRLYEHPGTGAQMQVPVNPTAIKQATAQGYKPVINPQTGQGVYQTQFAKGSWQGTLYDKMQTSVLKNIPHAENTQANYYNGSYGSSNPTSGGKTGA